MTNAIAVREVPVGGHVVLIRMPAQLIQVPLQDDSETCGLRVILNAWAAMRIGPLNDLVWRHDVYLMAALTTLSGLHQTQGCVCVAARLSRDSDWLGDEQGTQQVARLIEPSGPLPLP